MVATLLFEVGWQLGVYPFVHTGGVPECRFGSDWRCVSCRNGCSGNGTNRNGDSIGVYPVVHSGGTPECRFGSGSVSAAGMGATGMGAAGMGPTGMGAAGMGAGGSMGAAGGKPTVAGRPSQNSPQSWYNELA